MVGHSAQLRSSDVSAVLGLRSARPICDVHCPRVCVPCDQPIALSSPIECTTLMTCTASTIAESARPHGIDALGPCSAVRSHKVLCQPVTLATLCSALPVLGHPGALLSCTSLGQCVGPPQPSPSHTAFDAHSLSCEPPPGERPMLTLVFGYTCARLAWSTTNASAINLGP